jgi:hypothetical protein
MLRKFVLAIVAGSAVGLGATAVEAYAGPSWYRKGGGRWHGISGLSFYHANRLLTELTDKGYEAYFELER